MPIHLKIFGDLRKKIKPQIIGTTSLKFDIDNSEITYIVDILKRLNIKENEVSHIIVNGIYAGLMKKVKNKDTIALFPRNMALLYKWYFNRDEDV
ncbi:MAG: hypothetical protein ACFFB0_13805 [Promethearchaeota archaeon]